MKAPSSLRNLRPIFFRQRVHTFCNLCSSLCSHVSSFVSIFHGVQRRYCHPQKQFHLPRPRREGLVMLAMCLFADLSQLYRGRPIEFAFGCSARFGFFPFRIVRNRSHFTASVPPSSPPRHSSGPIGVHFYTLSYRRSQSSWPAPQP